MPEAVAQHILSHAPKVRMIFASMVFLKRPIWEQKKPWGRTIQMNAKPSSSRYCPLKLAMTEMSQRKRDLHMLLLEPELSVKDKVQAGSVTLLVLRRKTQRLPGVLSQNKCSIKSSTLAR